MNSGIWFIVPVLLIAAFAIVVSLDSNEKNKTKRGKGLAKNRNNENSKRGKSGEVENGPRKGKGEDNADQAPQQSALIIPPPDVQKFEAIPPINHR